MESLANRVVIVTGGSSGIGRAICLALSDEGCKVAVLSRHRSPKYEAIEPTDTLLKEGIWVYCDVSKSPFQSPKQGSPSGSLSEAMQTVVDRWGRLDILVNNAGALNAKDFLEQTEEEYDNLLDTNLKGSFFGSQIAIRQMLKQSPPGGQIINIASIYALVPSWVTLFGASKAALVNLTENIASEFGETIKCNCICPGHIEVKIDEGHQQSSHAALRGNVLHEIPIHRRGKPGEVAEVVVWVLKSSYMNGSTFVVDGGRNARATTGIRFPDWESPSA